MGTNNPPDYYDDYCDNLSSTSPPPVSYSFLDEPNENLNLNEISNVSVLSDSSDISDLDSLLPDTNLNSELVEMISRTINLQDLQ